MSKDFPNREDWLAIRNTPRKRPTKIFHQSTQYKEEINEKTKEKIYLPFRQLGETAIDLSEPSSTLTSINSADGSSLEELPGIGPVTAAAIISGRPYSSLNDLLTNKIVKSAVFEKIKKLITL